MENEHSNENSIEVSKPKLFGEMQKEEYAWVRNWFWILTLAIFFLITLGGLVRNEGAGLACPDWPLCFGEVVPPMNYQVFLEWFHRLVAGSISLIYLGLSVYIFRKPQLRGQLLAPLLIGWVLLLAQVFLGGMTVLGLLHPSWVSSHLAVGVLFFGTALTLSLKSRKLDQISMSLFNQVFTTRDFEKTWGESGLRQLSQFSRIVLIAVYLQIILGGMVSSNYAGLACPDFPLCHGEWFPRLEGGVALQWLHRVGGLTVAILTIVFFTLFLRNQRLAFTQRVRVLFWIFPFVVFLQLCIGILMVWYNLPILMSVAHLGIATFLFGLVLVIRHELHS